MRKEIVSKMVVSVLVLFALIPVPAVMTAEEAPSAMSTQNPLVQTTPPANPVLEVSFNAGLLSVKAEGADLGALLGKIASASGVEIEVGKDVAGKVSIAFEGIGLEEGIKMILESVDARNYLASFDRPPGAREGEFSLSKVSVVRKGAEGTKDVRASDFPKTPEGVREYLRAKYGEGVKIEGIQGRSAGIEKPVNWIAFYQPGISKRLNRENITKFAEEMLSEFSYFLDLDLHQVANMEVSENLDEIGLGGIQAVNGVPVEDTGIGVNVKKRSTGGSFGPDLIKIGSFAYPNIILPTEPKISREEAEGIAGKNYRSRFYDEDWAKMSERERAIYHPTKLLIYPREVTISSSPLVKNYEYHLSWVVRFMPREYYIDALTGSIVDTHKTVIDEMVAGKLSGVRYGRFLGASYVDDYMPYQDGNNGLGGLYIWDLNPDGQQPSAPFVLTSTGEGSARGTFEVDASWLPVYARLQTAWYRIYSSEAATDFLEWQSGNDGLYPSPFDGPDNGYQANIHQQLVRGYLYLFNDGIDNNVPPAGLDIIAAQNLGPLVMGRAIDNSILKYTASGALSSDTILHELSHAAVYTIHNGYVGGSDEQFGVSEGVASFFPCRMNKDQVDHSSSISSEYNYGDGSQRIGDKNNNGLIDDTEGDWNGDNMVSNLDYEHYDNGHVIASILWDLAREETANHATDVQIWKSVLPSGEQSNQGGIVGYAPEALYDALSRKEVDRSLLWTTFSAHGVNLWVDQQSEGGLALHWFQHYGSEYIGYKVYRNTTDQFDDNTLVVHTAGSKSETSWVDLSATPGVKYYYRVRPYGSGTIIGPFSNTAFETAAANNVSGNAIFTPYGN